ncbi:MAG: hypothetical protein NT036_02870 [Candidatus Omnitrophica bacterium]|nr:hypothetical protein [Candidatus Omnitrophota bacterium]
MPDKRISLIVTVFVCLCAFSLLAAGCGQKNNVLNLPEQEARQIESTEQASAEKAAPAEGNLTPDGKFKKFYVYADRAYFKNHFIPSGWMGDYGDVELNDGWSFDPFSRKSCIRVVYSAQRKQGAGWTGIYWQEPANNWGSLKGGFNLAGAKKIVFHARGDKGGEIISEFKIGGISGEFSDSGTATIGPITLDKEWKEYSIDLENEDLSCIIGGFTFVISSQDNPNGATFYLDEIYYE